MPFNFPLPEDLSHSKLRKNQVSPVSRASPAHMNSLIDDVLRCRCYVDAYVAYTRKNYQLLKTGLNNVVLPILLFVVNNIEQVVEPESSPQSGVTMLNNIVDIIEQCGQHNIVLSCFQQPVTTYNFWLCTSPHFFVLPFVL